MQNEDNSKSVPIRASFKYRAFAFMTDFFVITLILVVPFILFTFRHMENNPEIMFMAFPVFMITGFFAACFKDIFKGQSLGKFIFGIAVRDSDDETKIPPATKLFVRNVFSFLWPIELIVLLISKRKLGDKIAGTDVYLIRKKPRMLIVIVTAIVVFMMFAGSLFFVIISIFRNHPSYHTALNYIETNPRIIELVGDVEGFGFFPTGSIHISGGHGQADFTIRVDGSEGTVRVHVRLIREPLRDWEVISFYYRR